MTDAPADPTPQAPAQPQIRVLGQYAKDLSFENPGAPDSLRAGGQPQIDMGIDVRARQLDEQTYEVELQLSARAQRENQPVFVTELVYAGLFQLLNVDDVTRQPVLFIECPRLLFPFARRILADATRDGGFPPLMLEPVDFANLFRQRQAQAQGAAENGGEPAAQA